MQIRLNAAFSENVNKRVEFLLPSLLGVHTPAESLEFVTTLISLNHVNILTLGSSDLLFIALGDDGGNSQKSPSHCYGDGIIT